MIECKAVIDQSFCRDKLCTCLQKMIVTMNISYFTIHVSAATILVFF